MMVRAGAVFQGGKWAFKGGLALACGLTAPLAFAQTAEQGAAPAPNPSATAAPASEASLPPPAATAQPAIPAQPVAATPVPHPPGHHDPRRAGEEEPGIVVSGDSRPLAPDPGKALNKASYAATQVVDGALIEPLAKGYRAALPRPGRDGLHNAIYNLREPISAANFLLQHKISKSGETLARFVINSTIGLAGIFDIARRKPFKIPRRENGFANTLGFYGVGNGPYIYLPVLGATTLRDFTGRMVDRAVVPIAVGGQLLPTAAVVPIIVIGVLDRRLINDERLREERESGDPYGTTRDNYLRRRAAEIEALRHPHAAQAPAEKEEG